MTIRLSDEVYVLMNTAIGTFSALMAVYGVYSLTSNSILKIMLAVAVSFHILIDNVTSTYHVLECEGGSK